MTTATNIMCPFCGSRDNEANPYEHLSGNPYHCLNCYHGFGKELRPGSALPPKQAPATITNNNSNSPALSSEQSARLKNMSSRQKQSLKDCIDGYCQEAGLVNTEELLIVKDAEERKKLEQEGRPVGAP